MSPLRARVDNGRLRLDEPTELPEGTELDLVVDDEGDGDDLTDRERQALHEASSWSSTMTNGTPCTTSDDRSSVNLTLA